MLQLERGDKTTNTTDGGGGRREEVNKTIQKSAKIGGAGKARISCNTRDRV